MRHVLDREVEGSNLGEGKNLLIKINFSHLTVIIQYEYGIHAFRIEERALVRCDEKKRARSEEMMAGTIIRMCQIFNFRREWIRERMVRFELAIRLNGQRQTWKIMERKMI